MRDRIELEPAWLLASRPYRETSELIEVFTARHGRVGLVARGARGPKSRQRGVLASFRPLLVSWIESGDLGTMTAVESAGPDIELVGERIFHGWYLNELLMKLLQRHDPHPDVHDDYADALRQLAGTELEAEAALRIFEKRLLEQLGYGLGLEASIDAEARYLWQPGNGLARTDSTRERSFAGASLLALHDERLATRAVLDDARRLLRAVLEPHVPRESLRTPKLLLEMRGLRSGTS